MAKASAVGMAGIYQEFIATALLLEGLKWEFAAAGESISAAGAICFCGIMLFISIFLGLSRDREAAEMVKFRATNAFGRRSVDLAVRLDPPSGLRSRAHCPIARF